MENENGEIIVKNMAKCKVFSLECCPPSYSKLKEKGDYGRFLSLQRLINCMHMPTLHVENKFPWNYMEVESDNEKNLQ